MCDSYTVRDMQSRRLAGVIIWRSLSVDEIVKAKVLEEGIKTYNPEQMKKSCQPEADAKSWLKVELLAVDHGLASDHHIGEMILGAAMQMSLQSRPDTVIGPPRLVLTDKDKAGETPRLAQSLGFEPAPGTTKSHQKSSLAGQMRLSIVFDIEDRLRGLLCPRREAVSFAPIGGRLPLHQKPAGHRIGTLAPRFPSRTAYTDASSNGRDGQCYGDAVHVTTQPLSANSITAQRVMAPNLQVKTEDTYQHTTVWGQGKHGVYHQSALLSPSLV